MCRLVRVLRAVAVVIGMSLLRRIVPVWVVWYSPHRIYFSVRTYVSRKCIRARAAELLGCFLFLPSVSSLLDDYYDVVGGAAPGRGYWTPHHHRLCTVELIRKSHCKVPLSSSLQTARTTPRKQHTTIIFTPTVPLYQRHARGETHSRHSRTQRGKKTGRYTRHCKGWEEVF